MVGDVAGRHRITVGGDTGYDVQGFAAGAAHPRGHAAWRAQLPHQERPAAPILDRWPGPPRHPGYAISQRRRKLVEEAFGWIKTVAGQAKTRLRRLDCVGWSFSFAAAA
jgi:hypothetical protein